MSNHRESRYFPNHAYTTPSRTAHLSTAAAPPIYDLEQLGLTRNNVMSHVFKEGDFICPGFFDKVNLEYFNPDFKATEWFYSMRRGAQAILPFLYLGPSSFLKDLGFLSANGFTLLLAVRSRQSAHARLVSGEAPAAYLGIEADTIDVMDSQELMSVLPRAVRRINDHLASSDPGKTETWPPKKIFIFCESGNERSAMVVVAYVMVMYNMNFGHAVSVVQQRRFSISIEEKLRQLMVNFELILVAKRDVERTRRAAEAEAVNSTASMPASKKRNLANLLDADAGGDDGMDIDDSQDSHAERKPMAPFQDR